MPRARLAALQLERLRAAVGQVLRRLDQTGLRVNVVIAPPCSIPRSEGKAVRAIDRR
jgi:phenylacetate-coenzyme A ligase PaaK-like adenylate-forming protein